MNTGICGKCGATVRAVISEESAITIENRAKVLRAVTFRCPKCQAVLGIQDDPAVTDGKVEEIEATLSTLKKELAEMRRHMQNAAMERRLPKSSPS